MFKRVFPIELLRVLLALIGLGSAYMAGRTIAAVRKRQIKAARHYAWMVRAVVCLASLAFRHVPDTVMLGAWALAPAAFAAAWYRQSHQPPPEDLSHEIVPHDL